MSLEFHGTTTFPIRRKRPLDDPFFSEGNYIARKDSSSHSFFYIEKELEENEHSWNQNNNCVEQDLQDGMANILCASPGCGKIFHSHEECEKHYQGIHINNCSECGMIFNNSHLLDLHFEETHDSFFTSALKKGKMRCRCLLQECKSTFLSDEERTKHLRSVHGYPNWFRFHPRRNKEEEDILLDRILTRRKWLDKRAKPLESAVPNDTTNIEANVDLNETYMCHSGQDFKKKSRSSKKERQKEIRARIPCRFAASEKGCFRGEACAFSHTSDHGLGSEKFLIPESKENICDPYEVSFSMEIDNLVNDIHDKVRVSVPEKICFGRKRR